MFKIVIRYLPYIFHIIYFNFHYLPFRQAVRLPIFLFKPKLLNLKGKIVIKSDIIKTGMIKLGQHGVSLFPDSGIIWDNNGGTVLFQGYCSIGNASAVSLGENGNIIFGNNFSATAALKIVSYYEITFSKDVLIGWDNIFMDTDFHQIKTLEGKNKKSYGAIWIGENNWFGFGCVILKNTKTPDHIIVSGKSLLNKMYDIPSYSVIGGSPAKLISTGLYRDPENDVIIYKR